MKPGARVLEIASNDGSHLSCLAARGFDAMGIDPARNLNDIAAAAGHKVLTGFFPDVRPDGRFDVVVAMNVAAHTPTPLRFLAGVADVLAPGGVAIVQTSQALMLGNGEFDTVYHEHYSFFTVASMRALAARAGLRLEQVQLVAIHGTSLLLFLRRADETGPAIAFKGEDAFAVAWPDPQPAFLSPTFGGAEAEAAYAEFAAKARASMAAVAARIAAHKAQGRQIALVGVAAKALTFIRAAGIAPDLYLDEAPLKIGRFVPGASVPIAPLASIAEPDARHRVRDRRLEFRRGAEAARSRPASSGSDLGSWSIFRNCERSNEGKMAKRVVISHFFNEAYLLPWWLEHHRQIFDHGVLIDWSSTDGSADICRQLAPGWEVVRLRACAFRGDPVRLRGDEARGALSRGLEDRAQHHGVPRGAAALPTWRPCWSATS